MKASSMVSLRLQEYVPEGGGGTTASDSIIMALIEALFQSR
jgi:hypothetical protein